MSTSFLSLAREIRDEIYGLALVLQESIEPYYFKTESPSMLASGLFRVNKIIHHEATSLFYAQNCFESGTSGKDNAKEMGSFLEKIGPKNAGYIRHIGITIPKFVYFGPGVFLLVESSIGFLENLIRYGPTLSTVTMTILHKDFKDMKCFAKSLELVIHHLKTRSSLQDIIVKLSEGGPKDLIQSEMENRGWNVSITEYVEEDYDSGFGVGPGYYDDEYEDKYQDEYNGCDNGGEYFTNDFFEDEFVSRN